MIRRLTLFFLLCTVSLHAQTRTSIRDTLYNADGSRTAGQIEITWNGFRSPDGKTIAAGKTTRRITDGVLDLALVPNAGATPAGTSYAVTYLLANGLSYSETWVVPQSDTPVSLAAVSASAAPAPSVQVGQQQLSEGGGLQVLLDFYRAASATATRAGQCYWNTAANGLYCATGAGAWQNYTPGMPGSHASTHAGNSTDPISIDTSQITSGMLADARLPGAITGDKTLNGSLTLGSGSFKFTGTVPGPTYPYPPDADLDTIFPFGAIRVNGKAVAYATDSAWGIGEETGLIIPGNPLTILSDYGWMYAIRRDASEAGANAKVWALTLSGYGTADNPTSIMESFRDDEGDAFMFWSLARHNTGDYAGYQVVLDPDRAGGTAVGGNFKVFGNAETKKLNGIPLAHLYPGNDAGAKIIACIAALPATGGICDARGLEDAQAINVNIFAGVVKPVRLQFTPSATFTLSTPQWVTSDVTIEGNGATFKLLNGFNGDNTLLFGTVLGGTNIHFRDLILDGNRANQAGGVTDGNSFGVRFSAVTNSSIQNVTFKDFWTDGIYIGGDGKGGVHSDGIVISNVSVTNSRRNGMSITDGQNILVANSQFLNAQGTAPQAGVDLEPNLPAEVARQIQFVNCRFSGNAALGFVAHNSVGADVKRIQLSGSADDNGSFGFQLNTVDQVMFSAIAHGNGLGAIVSTAVTNSIVGLNHRLVIGAVAADPVVALEISENNGAIYFTDGYVSNFIKSDVIMEYWADANNNNSAGFRKHVFKIGGDAEVARIDETGIVAGTAVRTGAPEASERFDAWGGNMSAANPGMLGSDSLTDGSFALCPGGGCKWGVTGGWNAAFTGKSANYNGAGGAGDLTQTAANMAVAGIRNRWYAFTYTVTVPLGVIGATITNAFASAAVTLPLTAGARTVYFKSNAAPGTFTIAATGAGSFTIDGLSLEEIVGGDGIFNGFVNWSGQKRVTAQFDKTNDAALGDIPGLSVVVQAGRTYSFEAILFTSSNVATGVQAAIAGTATATAIIYDGLTVNAGLATQGRAVALGGAVGGVTAVTAAQIRINGTITVNAGGTLTVQFAQNVAGGVASSVLVGSTFIVQNIP